MAGSDSKYRNLLLEGVKEQLRRSTFIAVVPLWATSTAEAQAVLEECCKSYPVGCNPSRVFSSPLVQVFQQITQVDFAPQNPHVVTATQVVTPCEVTGEWQWFTLCLMETWNTLPSFPCAWKCSQQAPSLSLR